MVAKSIGEYESSVNDQEDDDVDSEASDGTNDVRQQQKKRTSKLRKLRHLDISDKSDDNSSHASSKESDLDSDPEVYVARPTRSGRLPKPKNSRRVHVKRESDTKNVSSVNDTATSSQEVIDVNVLPDSSENTTTICPENLTTVIPNIIDNKIEPGSLVILSRESTEEPGNTIVQVYMVSSNVDTNADVKCNVTPVDLPPKLLTTVTEKLEEAESINMSNDCEQ